MTPHYQRLAPHSWCFVNDANLFLVLFFKHLDLSENMFAPIVFSMFITYHLPTNFFIPIYDLLKNLINQIFSKTLTPHFWRHNARKVALTPEMWCRHDCSS